MPHATTAEALRAVLAEALAADPGLVLVAETVGGVAGSMAGLPALNLPVAERGSLGFALGLALGGKRVVVELSGVGRLAAVAEVLAEAGAVAAAREFPVPLTVRVPYGSEAPGIDLPAGRWLSDLPGVRVVCPSTPAMAAGLLRAALSGSEPTVILEPRALYGERREIGSSPASSSARVLREGRHVTLVGWGAGVAAATEAAEALAGDGIEAGVVDLVSLSPLDRATLGAQVRTTGRLVVVHPDDPALAEQVRQVAVDEAFLYLEAPLAAAPSQREAVARAARSAVTY